MTWQWLDVCLRDIMRHVLYNMMWSSCLPARIHTETLRGQSRQTAVVRQMVGAGAVMSQPGPGQGKAAAVAAAAVAPPPPAGQAPLPYRVLNVPGSRPYASGRYASAVPAWSEGAQPSGPEQGTTQQLQQGAPEARVQLTRQQAQQAQLHAQQAQHVQHAQQQQEAVAGGLPQGVTFQAPPGATVAGEDARPLSAPAQVRYASHYCFKSASPAPQERESNSTAHMTIVDNQSGWATAVSRVTYSPYHTTCRAQPSRLRCSSVAM